MNQIENFNEVAIKIATRRMTGLINCHRAMIEPDGSISILEAKSYITKRIFDTVIDFFGVLHKEAFRELIVKAGKSPAYATWTWHNQIVKFYL